MQNFASAKDAITGIQEFLYDREAALPDDVRETMKALAGPGSPPFQAITNTAKLIYARRGELDKQVLELGAALALVAEQFQFNDMGVDNLGSRMALTLMRDAEVEQPAVVTKYPEPQDDPDADNRFVVVEPAPATLPAPAEGARRPRTKRVTDTNKS